MNTFQYVPAVSLSGLLGVDDVWGLIQIKLLGPYFTKSPKIYVLLPSQGPLQAVPELSCAQYVALGGTFAPLASASATAT